MKIVEFFIIFLYILLAFCVIIGIGALIYFSTIKWGMVGFITSSTIMCSILIASCGVDYEES